MKTLSPPAAARRKSHVARPNARSSRSQVDPGEHYQNVEDEIPATTDMQPSDGTAVDRNRPPAPAIRRSTSAYNLEAGMRNPTSTAPADPVKKFPWWAALMGKRSRRNQITTSERNDSPSENGPRIASSRKRDPRDRSQSQVEATTGARGQANAVANHAAVILTLPDLSLPCGEHASPAKILQAAADKSTVLNEATKARQQVIQGLLERRQANVIATRVQEYLPRLFDCAAIAEDLRMRNVNFPATPIRWTSALSPNMQAPSDLNRRPSISGGFPLDIVFVLSVNALNSIQAVLTPPGTLLLSENTDVWVNCNKQLQHAAGMFDYLAARAVPAALQFCSTPPPAELDPAVHRALSKLCLSLAQVLVLRKADLDLQKSNLLSKLAIGALSMLKETTDALQPCREILFPCVLSVPAELSQLVAAWSQRLLADVAKSKEYHGEALARMRLAVVDLEALAMSNSIFGALAQRWLPTYLGTRNTFDDDNEKRYLQVEPAVADLQLDMKAGKQAVEAVQFAPPQDSRAS